MRHDQIGHQQSGPVVYWRIKQTTHSVFRQPIGHTRLSVPVTPTGNSKLEHRRGVAQDGARKMPNPFQVIVERGETIVQENA